MNLGSTSFKATSLIRDSNSTCSSRKTDCSYCLVSQLSHPSLTDKRAPMALKLAEASFCSDAKSFRPRRQFIVRFEYEYEGFGLFIDQFVMHAQLLNSKIGAVPSVPL